MSTNSPPAKTSESTTSIECSTAAVAANEADHDVFVVGVGQIQPIGNVVLKEEKLVDLVNDPSFSMLQQGGGQVWVGVKKCTVNCIFSCNRLGVVRRSMSSSNRQSRRPSLAQVAKSRLEPTTSRLQRRRRSRCEPAPDEETTGCRNLVSWKALKLRRKTPRMPVVTVTERIRPRRPRPLTMLIRTSRPRRTLVVTISAYSFV